MLRVSPAFCPVYCYAGNSRMAVQYVVVRQGQKEGDRNTAKSQSTQPLMRQAQFKGVCVLNRSRFSFQETAFQLSFNHYKELLSWISLVLSLYCHLTKPVPLL
ncbi:hypothetical protein GOODEAATRI_023484 [Goodea atripinnis]|uniref:Uncharacterized protein n=1 Tax=Goodea atripinnis TaxID=208336 RepID=A0ABV0PR25_9TELE